MADDGLISDLVRARQALDALRIQGAVTALALRYDPRLVMQVVRDWLDYMDRQADLLSRQ